MCFDADAQPPIPVIAGGAIDSAGLTLTAADGNVFKAFRARAAEPGGAGIVILPDVRGLFPYYEELALRFAEAGVDAVALDYFGRTAGVGDRGADFEYRSHVEQTRFGGLNADVAAATAFLRSPAGGAPRSVFVVGFCFGGLVAFDTAALGLGLAGVIGFYGKPTAPRGDIPAAIDLIPKMTNPVLGLFGGADTYITEDDLATFDAALGKAGIEHRLVSYRGAPHSFFDRSYEEHAEASAAAWAEVLAFIKANTVPA